MKKVLGIHSGRKHGNSEILLKAALSEIRQGGMQVKVINLRDHQIIPCTGCGAGGDLEKDENGKWQFVVSEESLATCRSLTAVARTDHFFEIQATQKEFYDCIDQFEGKLKKYKELEFDTV